MFSNIIGTNNTSNPYDSEQLIVEKKNLLNLFKLVLKELIQSSISNNKTIDKHSNHFANFFDVYELFLLLTQENILDHGLKNKKGFGFNFRRKDFSSLVDLISSKCDLGNCMTSIKEMSEIKTPLGRIRAWIKLTLMQKTLAENFSLLINEKDFLNDAYEKESILVSDEASIISGLLVGLNAFDVTIDLKSDLNDFDSPLRSVNYNLYLRERIPGFDDVNENESPETKLNEIFDQKNYLEELNKRLETNQAQLQSKVKLLEESNMMLTQQLAKTQNENIELKINIEKIECEKKKLENDFKNKMMQLDQDIKVERETYVNSKSGLDQMYIELQKKVLEESISKITIENELQNQINMKKELESAIKLMDKSLAEKQELVNKLREQLDQIKKINLDLMEKIQKNESSNNKAVQDASSFKDCLEKITNESEELKKKFETNESLLKSNIKKLKEYEQQTKLNDEKIAQLEKDFNIEKNWRIHLQQDLSSKNELIQVLNGRIESMNDTEKEYNRLKSDYSILKEKCNELDNTLEEMGSKLGNSHLRMQDFKEVTKQFNEFQWENDEDVANCKICIKEFNVARRKHHCRRCGGIFCHECSDNKMPLPSSSKPVRVCNICYSSILQTTTLK